MEKIGIIAAMAPEMELLRDEMSDVSEIRECGISFYLGYIMDKEVVLSLCGVGKVNAAMAATILISKFECNLIINSGIAGGMAPLEPKDVIVADRLMYHDFDTTPFGYSYGQVPGMPKEFIVNPELLALVRSTLNKLDINYKVRKVYSGDKFVTSPCVLEAAGGLSDCASEMEGAAIAHVCIKAGVDFLIIRFISDIIGCPSQINDYNSFEVEMANLSSGITHKLISNL